MKEALIFWVALIWVVAAPVLALQWILHVLGHDVSFIVALIMWVLIDAVLLRRVHIKTGGR